MKKVTIIIVLVSVLVIIFGIIGVNAMKKDLPYDFEIVPTDGGFWLINTTVWADKDCIVSVEEEYRDEKTAVLSAKEKSVKIDGLANGRKYGVTVNRNDLIGRIRYRSIHLEVIPSDDVKNYFVLVGASVGKSWNLNELRARMKVKDKYFGYRGMYEFDKSPAIELIAKSQIKPDAVIIKECAAYFPRDTVSGINHIKDWMKVLRDHGIPTILATVVPVTKENNQKSNRMNSINQFNQAVRLLGKEENILVLDLQNALSENDENGYLKNDYADIDGLHLKNEAYAKKLDELLLNLVDSKVNEK